MNAGGKDLSVTITILSENTAARLSTLGEWGFSALIETGSETALLDAGQTDTAIRNARTLNVDLSGITSIVLSHGHNDHTGGLVSLLSLLKKEVDVFAHPDVWAPKYAFRSNRYGFVGVPYRREHLEDLGARFVFTREVHRIGRDIVVSGEIPLANDFEQVDSNLFLREGDGFVPDPLLDDRSLAIKTGAGLVIVSGCAHRGIINTIRYFTALTGNDLVHAVIGGTHLITAKKDKLETTVRSLRELGVARVGACHCTGMAAAARLMVEFGDAFIPCNAGHKITLP